MAKKAKKNETAFVGVLLDESGSMSNARQDTIGGFNTFIDELKKNNRNRSIHFNLVKFGGEKPLDRVYVGAKLENVAHLTEAGYKPHGNTPLIDAAVKMIKALDEQRKKSGSGNVTLMLQTDGGENASVEYKRDDLKKLVEQKTEEGWQFIFVGADIDGYSDAVSYGFNISNVASYSKSATDAMFRTVGANMSNYMATGNLTCSTFTNEQKAAMGENLVVKK